MRRAIVTGIGLVLAVAAIEGCGPTIARRIDDGVITTRVKTALLNDPALGPLRLCATTVDGVVTLSGTVRSQEEVARAERLARGVAGVRNVRLDLVVRPLPLTCPSRGSRRRRRRCRR